MAMVASWRDTTKGWPSSDIYDFVRKLMQTNSRAHILKKCTRKHRQHQRQHAISRSPRTSLNYDLTICNILVSHSNLIWVTPCSKISPFGPLHNITSSFSSGFIIVILSNCSPFRGPMHVDSVAQGFAIEQRGWVLWFRVSVRRGTGSIQRDSVGEDAVTKHERGGYSSERSRTWQHVCELSIPMELD